MRGDADGGRECGCPSWVGHCAHFGGQLLAMNLGPPHHNMFVIWLWSRYEFVSVKTSPYLAIQGFGKAVYEGHDNNAALAAFREAEARLLAAEGEGL